MTTTDDLELLHDYASQRSEEAFHTLVDRHAALVHGAARRLVRDETLAQDVTHIVFILLARKADRLPSGIILAGWLYQTTRWVASQALRAERRRRLHHERFATMQETPDPNSDSACTELPPDLEKAMARLNENDRNAVLLRYLRIKVFQKSRRPSASARPLPKCASGALSKSCAPPCIGLES